MNYIGLEVEFFISFYGTEEVYKGKVTDDNGVMLTVFCPAVNHSVEIHREDLVEQDDYGFGDETFEPITRWYGDD